MYKRSYQSVSLHERAILKPIEDELDGKARKEHAGYSSDHVCSGLPQVADDGCVLSPTLRTAS
jgi:hypothetical protein